MLTLFTCEETTMRVDGKTVITFLAGIEKAIDDAGVGKYRALKLLDNLAELGLSVEAAEIPPTLAVVAVPESKPEEMAA